MKINDVFGPGFGLLGVLFPIVGIFAFGIAVCSIIFWICMISDAVKRKYSNPDDKTMWILVVALAGIIGAVIYYFMIKRKDKYSQSNNN